MDKKEVDPKIVERLKEKAKKISDLAKELQVGIFAKLVPSDSKIEAVVMFTDLEKYEEVKETVVEPVKVEATGPASNPVA